MPRPTKKHYAKCLKEGKYRLQCSVCDREDYDGVKSLPKDWKSVERFQSLLDSMTTYDEARDPEPPKGYSVSDWMTHKGICPECQKENYDV